MSAFLFGTCGCCLGGILGGVKVIARAAAVPYTMGWTQWPDGVIRINPLGATPPQGIPPSVFLTEEGFGQRTSYDRLSNKTITPSDYTGALRYSDPYPFAEAVAGAAALMKKVDFGGTFPSATGDPVRLCFAADAAPGEVNVQQVLVTQDYAGKINYDGSDSFLVPAAYAANGSMGITTVSGWIGLYYDGQVVVRECIIRTPFGLKQQKASWFDFGPGPGIGYPGGAGGSYTIPTDLGPGEYVFDYTQAPARGILTFGSDPAPALGA